MTLARRGVIYVATGEDHVDAARRSARSVRLTNDGLGLVLFSDSEEQFAEFDRVEPIPNPHRRSKVDMLLHSPFEQTLYLDTDTRVIGDLTPAFGLLERFDLAVAQRLPDPPRLRRPQADGLPPVAFPEHNGGVLLFGNSVAVGAFLTRWSEAYHERGRTADQVTLREVLWNSDIRFVTLPPRYNTRKYTWLQHWFRNGPPPVVLHLNRFHPTKHGRGLRHLLSRLGGPGG